MDETNKFIESLRADMQITIMPEDATEGIEVSKTILCQTSEYFVGALDKEFKEASDKILRFPGWKSDIVKHFLFWAYKQILPEMRVRGNGTTPTDHAVQMTLTRLWLFGDAYLIPRLQNAAMRELVDMCEASHTPANVIRLGFEGARKDSALHKFIMDEARYEYFINTHDGTRLTEEQLEDLASMAGFLQEFMEPLKKCIGNDSEKPVFQSAEQCGFEKYEVEEE